MSHNGGGHLYSIDLGNPPEEPPNDFFLRSSHHDHWTLIIGDSKQELPKLLDELEEIDHFHHDSLHTYEHMMWEYEIARDHLRPGGALSSDDVSIILDLSKPFERSPFAEFCARQQWVWGAMRNFGVAVKELPGYVQATDRQSVVKFGLPHRYATKPGLAHGLVSRETDGSLPKEAKRRRA